MKKLLKIILSIILCITLVACNSNTTKEVSAFTEFINQEFIDEMESDYLTMHTYLENPEDYGIDENKVEVNLGSRFDEDTLEENKQVVQETYEKFQEFERDDLTDEEKDIYDTYKYMIELAIEMNNEKFDYYNQLFESANGIHYQLPSLFSDWQIVDEQDAQDLIILVNDTLDYINSALDYTQRQEEKGLLMIDKDSVIEYCQGIVDAGMDGSILAAMEKTLTDAGYENYITELQEAFNDSFLVAYQNIIDALNNCNNINAEGYCKFEYGAEYYSLLLEYKVGCQMSVDEIEDFMEEAYNDHIMNMMMAYYSNPNVFEEEYTTNLTNYQEILDLIEENMKNDFPSVGTIDYDIETINEEIASSSGVAAYFEIPALDASTNCQIRVNPKLEDINSIDTFKTVAHEGFPGHMYQYAYMYQNVDSLYLKTVSSNNAFVEGYAVYAGYYALNYLDIDEDYLTMYKENELATYAIIILADIGIHYRGWDEDEFMDYCTNLGLSLDDETAQKQYLQLQANPGIFESYYVGYEKIADLQEEAEDTLGSSYSDLAFHTALLECGIVSFDIIEDHIDNYIQNNS
ncbi:MAG: DUF885 domain-containing protein [Erysipelotrichaceae bacterium]|nr:DUF885 domain-containing protein [Erysipelotrichaceae bacterium]